MNTKKLASSQIRDLVQNWGAAQDTFEQAPPPGSEWAQTNTPSQQAASAGPLVCIICLNQSPHLVMFLTAQVLNWSNCYALLSHVQLWAASARACKECRNYAAMDKINQSINHFMMYA